VTYADHCDIASYAAHPLEVVTLNPSGGVRSKIKSVREYFQSYANAGLKPLLSGYQPALHTTLAGMRGFHTLMHDTPALFGDEDVRSPAARLRIAISNRIIGYGLGTGGKTIVTSEFLKDDCRSDFGVEAEVVRMGGFSEPGAFRIRPVRNQLRMLSISRIEANKRIDWMLDALAILESGATPLSASVDWHLDLVGKGSLLEDLTARAASLGLADRVHFHGFVPDIELPLFFAQAHLFLMPAVQGYGIPAIEALQRGIPVLLHRESGVSDILIDTPWATVITGGKEEMPDPLAQAIRAVVDGKHHLEPLPSIPTEDGWAAQVAALCEWI
jgi:glycosyltransferase involved in cell wall biosynthesis